MESSYPPTAQATAYSPYDTSVISVSTGEGKHVEKGEPIVKLTIPGADATAAEAKAMENSARTNYQVEKSAQSGPVQDAQKALEQAKADEAAAKDTVAQGGQADVASLTQARIAAEAALRQAQQDLQKSLAPNRQAISEASATLSMAKADAAKGIVRSPISGTVTSLKAQPGMMATSKEVLANIVNFSAATVQGIVPPELKDKVVRHAKVIVAFTGQSLDPVDGSVVEVKVAPPIEGQKSPGYLAVISLLDTKPLVQPNASVKRIGIKTGAVKGVLVVPTGAIVTTDGKSSVNVKSGDTWVSKPVETGITDGALIEIKSGLAEGDTVKVTEPVPSSTHI